MALDPRSYHKSLHATCCMQDAVKDVDGEDDEEEDEDFSPAGAEAAVPHVPLPPRLHSLMSDEDKAVLSCNDSNQCCDDKLFLEQKTLKVRALLPAVPCHHDCHGLFTEA